MLTRNDEAQLVARGLTLRDVEQQLERLRGGPSYVELERPATIGDGIVRFSESEVDALHADYEQARREGRLTQFVPASGAATRMFRELVHYQRGAGRGSAWPAVESAAEAGDSRAAALVEFARGLEHFAFYARLARVLRERGHDPAELERSGAYAVVLDALLAPDGLGYAERPKGLIEFHAYPEGSRTALEEHLVEAAALVRDAAGCCRLHVTVSPEHVAEFRRVYDAVAPELGRRFGVRFEVAWSAQKPLTDTVAVDEAGEALRDAGGRLVLRPGGHGALIENLSDLGGDIVLIKNIDNVQPDAGRALTLRWRKALAGHLVRTQREVFRYLDRLSEAEPEPELVDEALEFVRQRLHIGLDCAREPSSYQARRAFLIGRLGRPLRVCGVVRNTGEPGGGPFWTRGKHGVLGLQIVEAAQVDPRSPAQREVLRRSTHFNPVDLVCGVRDREGRAYDLRSFVDPATTIITDKTEGTRSIRALERPGLWNGAMAHWSTMFVELPLETFTPVKSVNDLLRPEHSQRG